MVTRGLYTSAASVFQNTFLSGDIDEDKLIPYIKRAQELYIFDFLGQNLYERMDELIYDADGDIGDDNAAYRTLAVEYIAPAVDYFAAAEYLRYGGYTASDNGIYRRSATNSTPAPQEEINRLIGALMSTAENRLSIAWDYLCDNSSLYPEWNTTTSGQRPPSNEPYQFGFM